MLKQILTTSALIVIGAASIQSATAADFRKFRQLVVEPSGKAAGGSPIKKLQLLVAPPTGVNASSDTPVVTDNQPSKKFIVAPQNGVASPSSDPIVTADGGDNRPPKKVQLIVAPPSGVNASGGTIVTGDNRDNGGDRPAKTKFQNLIVTPDTTPSVDARANQPVDFTDTADATPPQDTAPVDQTVETASATADTDVTATASDATPTDTASDDAAPASSEPAPAGVDNPRGLYTMLTDRGYGVEIVKRHADGNLVFLVTESGHDQSYLLLVDGHYGKVLARRSVDLSSYASSYHEEHYPVVSYTYNTDTSDNCDYGYGHTVSRY